MCRLFLHNFALTTTVICPVFLFCTPSNPRALLCFFSPLPGPSFPFRCSAKTSLPICFLELSLYSLSSPVDTSRLRHLDPAWRSAPLAIYFFQSFFSLIPPCPLPCHTDLSGFGVLFVLPIAPVCPIFFFELPQRLLLSSLGRRCIFDVVSLYRSPPQALIGYSSDQLAFSLHGLCLTA